MENRGYIAEGHSVNKPPYFNGSDYSYWQNRMQVFLRAQDHQIWNVVSRGPFLLPEDDETWTKDQITKSNLNWSTMNIMQCSLHPTEFSRVSSCATAKEMWDKLQVIYEGTSKVRETKANILVSEYEVFKMKPDETISEMFSRLTVLTNGLKSLGKSYTEYEIVKKILRSLTSIWHTKATVIEETRKLTSTIVDESIGS